jgi:hypothetical protein
MTGQGRRGPRGAGRTVVVVSAEAILSAIFHDILELPELVGDPDWDAYAAVVEVTDDVVAGSAFRYAADRPPIPSPAPRDLAAFTRLRDSMLSDANERWTVCVVRIDRDTARTTVNFVHPAEAGLWRVDPSSYARIAEALRPGAADFVGDSGRDQKP